jgi:hypothetical protein
MGVSGLRTYVQTRAGPPPAYPPSKAAPALPRRWGRFFGGGRLVANLAIEATCVADLAGFRSGTMRSRADAQHPGGMPLCSDRASMARAQAHPPPMPRTPRPLARLLRGQVGTIARRVGAPVDVDRRGWIIGFYPGTDVDEYRDRTAAIFEQAGPTSRLHRRICCRR